MVDTGITRQIDQLGRIVIPKEIRDNLHLLEGDPIRISVERDKILLYSIKNHCVFCNGEERINHFNATPVCSACIDCIKSLSTEGSDAKS